MRVLLLTQILPYPPDAGPRVKTWHVLKDMLAREHEVTLVSFVRKDEKQHLNVLESLCKQVVAIPIRRSRLKDIRSWILSIVTGRSFLIVRDDLREMRTVIKTLIDQNTYDIIYADQLSMTQFVPPKKDGIHQPYRIFDAHNATWMIIDRMREGYAWWLRPLLTAEMQRIKQYEGRIVREFDHTLAVTKIDRAALRAAVDGSHEAGISVLGTISVIPIAVDTEDLIPVEQIPTSREILTLGTLHYKPNADGIRWFLRNVFPLVQGEIPEVRLTIVGKNPPDEFLALAREIPESVVVTGYVKDLAPHFERSALIVVPVLAGSGMRVRILEAFARGMPVVTTSIGLEGIEAHPGSDVMVADTPFAFASSVIQILRDTNLQNELSKNGRKLAMRRYDWRIALRAMDGVYGAAQAHLAGFPKTRGRKDR